MLEENDWHGKLRELQGWLESDKGGKICWKELLDRMQGAKTRRKPPSKVDSWTLPYQHDLLTYWICSKVTPVKVATTRSRTLHEPYVLPSSSSSSSSKVTRSLRSSTRHEDQNHSITTRDVAQQNHTRQSSYSSPSSSVFSATGSAQTPSCTYSTLSSSSSEIEIGSSPSLPPSIFLHFPPCSSSSSSLALLSLPWTRSREAEFNHELDGALGLTMLGAP